MSSSKNKLLLLLIVALFVLLFAVGVQANIDCNLTRPASSGTIATGTQLNVSYNASSDGSMGNVTVKFQAQSVSTDNSSWVLISQVANTSNTRHVNYTIRDIDQIVDANDYQFRAICYHNGSIDSTTAVETATSSISSSVIIDRTSPSVTGTTSVGTITSNAATTISFNIANATSYKFSHTGDLDKDVVIIGKLRDVAFSQSIIPRNGASYVIVANDGTDTTTVTTTYTLDGKSKSVTKTIAKQQRILNATQKNNTPLIFVFGSVLLIVLIIIIAVASTKKRRR